MHIFPLPDSSFRYYPPYTASLCEHIFANSKVLYPIYIPSISLAECIIYSILYSFALSTLDTPPSYLGYEPGYHEPSLGICLRSGTTYALTDVDVASTQSPTHLAISHKKSPYYSRTNEKNALRNALVDYHAGISTTEDSDNDGILPLKNHRKALALNKSIKTFRVSRWMNGIKTADINYRNFCHRFLGIHVYSS
jgi:hypothetical protein